MDDPARAELRARYLNASMADGKGGSKSTAVRHWLRYCVFGRGVSPMRHLSADSPHRQKLAEEALLMDFAIWLAVTRPPTGGRGRPSVETIIKYISTIKAWHYHGHYRHFGYRIGADLELTRLRVRTQHLAEAVRVVGSGWLRSGPGVILAFPALPAAVAGPAGPAAGARAYRVVIGRGVLDV